MRATVSKRLLNAHADCGVPFKYSIMFLLKVHGFTVRDLQEAARISSGGLHQALDGQFQPSELLRAEMTMRLGVDPWAWNERHRGKRGNAAGGRRSQPTRSP